MKWKKFTKWFLILLVVAGITLLYTTRNQWMQNYIKREVSVRTHGMATLSFQKIKLDVFKKSLTIEHPSIQFKGLVLNPKTGLMLIKSDFNELKIHNLSLWDLFFKKAYNINDLTVRAPSFFLGSPDSAIEINNKQSFDPLALISLLQNQRLPEVPFRFHVKNTNILQGKIELLEKKDSSSYGAAHYNISIEDLKTIDSGARNNLIPVSYEKMNVIIRDLVRYSAQYRYNFHIDSLFYHSKGHQLVLNGIRYASIPKPKEKISPLNFNLSKVLLKGMTNDTAVSKNSLHFHRLFLDKGNLLIQNRENRKSGKKSDALNDLLNRIFHQYKSIRLDSVSAHQLRILYSKSVQDTILTIHDLQFNLLDTKISDQESDNVLQHFQFGNLNFKLNNVKWQEADNILKTNYVHYSSSNKKLDFKNISYQQNCSSSGKKQTFFNSDYLSLESLSIKKYIKGQQQKVTFISSSPSLNIWQNGSCSKKMKKENTTLFSLFVPEKVVIDKGTLNYYGRQKDTLQLRQLHVYADKLKGLTKQKSRLTYDTLFASSESGNFSSVNSLTKILTGRLKWENNIFHGKKIRLDQQVENKKIDASLPDVALKDIPLNALLRHHLVKSGIVVLQKPNIRIQILKQQPDSNKVFVSRSPYYVNFSDFKINQGNIRITSQKDDSLSFQSVMDLHLQQFGINADPDKGFTLPEHWELYLTKSHFVYGNYKGTAKEIKTGTHTDQLTASGVTLNDISQKKDLNLSIPNLKLKRIDFPGFYEHQNIHFQTAVFRRPTIEATLSGSSTSISHLLETKHIKFDSIQIVQSDFLFKQSGKKSNMLWKGKNLDLSYHPGLLTFPKYNTDTTINLLQYWDASVQELSLSDTLTHFHVIADQVALQSAQNKLTIGTLTGSNMPKQFVESHQDKAYTYFKLFNLEWAGLSLQSNKQGTLHVNQWNIPHVWVDVIHQTPRNQLKKKPKPLSFKFLYSKNSFLKSIRIDSTLFDNVNLSYLYDNRKKHINVLNERIKISNICIDSTLDAANGSDLFQQMIIDTRGKTIVSGDSMYVFHTKDIRINLPQKRISLDSITLLPRYPRQTFFKKSGTQTDRISIYGKSIDIFDFDLSSMLYNRVFRAGNVSFNRFNMLFERDKHYPQDTVTKPMPLDLLKEIPYPFKVDSVVLHKNLVSYYEFEKKSLLPGIFFIDDFNVYFLNVTNDRALIDSSTVLKVHGNGNLMRQTPLSFVLLMPYFAPNNQFWFSAQTQRADLSQFNSLMQNIVGISIRKGTGLADVQYVSGDDKVAKGNMLFEYKNLKLRLFNRKKAIMNKSLGSPFVNFMLNNLMIRSRNPKFLKPPRKGIVYFERDPHKSFINYLWKSSLSGILSTLGFNNKQQRIEKKSIKHSQRKLKHKSANKNER